MSELKKNKSKNTDKNTPGEGNTPAASFSSLTDKFSTSFKFIHNERFQRVFGLTLLLFATFLSFSFISYPFTWEDDYSKVVGDLFSPDVKVENWFGKLGALLSHIFIYKWFGIASFIFPFLAYITGLRITFNIGPSNIYKIYALSFFFLIFSSVTLGYLITNPVYVYLGGAYGYTISNLLNTLLGFAGTGILLFFVLLFFLVIAYNFSFELNKKQPLQKEESPPSPVKEPAEKNKTKQPLDISPINTVMVEEHERHEIEEEIDLVPEKQEIILSNSNEDIQFTVESPPKKEEELTPKEVAEALTAEIGEYDPTLDLASYQFPTIDLLENYGGTKDITINKEELNANKDRIIKTLGDYGLEMSETTFQQDNDSKRTSRIARKWLETNGV